MQACRQKKYPKTRQQKYISVSPSQSIISEFAPPNLGDATRLAGRGGWRLGAAREEKE